MSCRRGSSRGPARPKCCEESPDLILADEPTGNLDSRNGKRVVSLLRDLTRSQGTTVVVVTHDRALASRADITLSMKDGRVVHTRTKEPASPHRPLGRAQHLTPGV